MPVRILLITPDKSIFPLLRAALTPHPTTITQESATLPEAQAIMHRYSTKPNTIFDLVILDASIENSLDFIPQLRSNPSTAKTKIILLSTSSEISTVTAAISHNIEAFTIHTPAHSTLTETVLNFLRANTTN